MKSWKKITLGVTAVIAMATLVACSGGGSSSSKSESKETLNVAVWDYATTPEFKALFTAFEKENPGVTVKAVDIPSPNYEPKVTTMLSGGDKTDVLALKTLGQYASYASRGQLVDLTDHIKSIDTKASEEAYSNYDIDGKTYAQPYRNDFWVLYYNKTLTKKAGITDAQMQNMTWDDYVKYAKAMTDSSAGVYGAYQHTWRSIIQSLAAAQTKHNILDPSYDWMKPYYERALALQNDKVIMDLGTAKSTQITYASQFNGQKAAMMPMGTWFMAVIKSQKASGQTDVDWSIAPMPQNTANGKITTMSSPTAFAINKHAANSKLAQKFLDFISGEKGAEVLAKVGVTPAYRTDAIINTYFSQDGMPTDEVAKKAFQPDETQLDLPIDKNGAAIDQALQQEHELVLTGSESVDEGIANMEKRVKDIEQNN